MEELYQSVNRERLNNCFIAGTTYDDFIRSGELGAFAFGVEGNTDSVDKFRKLIITLQEKNMNARPREYCLTKGSLSKLSDPPILEGLGVYDKRCMLDTGDFKTVFDEEYDGKIILNGIAEKVSVDLVPHEGETAADYERYFVSYDEKHGTVDTTAVNIDMGEDIFADTSVETNSSQSGVDVYEYTFEDSMPEISTVELTGFSGYIAESGAD